MKKNFLAVLIFLFSPYLMAQSTQPTKNQRYFDINKNIDIFNSVLKELDMFYVDSIKVDSLVQGTVRKCSPDSILTRNIIRKKRWTIFGL
jgi:carboxyl-terminal processing protease